jgi:2-polyprenyl-6-methoxyphenol hydroxylase-like FAD-dependent oxidoreductase
MSTRRSTHDVVVVGARCAGAATAMLLARHGHDVVVVDRARFPSDTLSTHGILRSGVVQLSRWGLLGDVLASGAPPVRQVSFRVGAAEDVRTVKGALLRDTYDITCALSEYPEPGRFVELQRQFAQAIDAEARFLAALPAVPAPVEEVAA